MGRVNSDRVKRRRRPAGAAGRGRWAWVLALWAALAGAAVGRDPFTHFFYQSFGDLREEAEAAREAGQVGLLVMFDDDECPWCHKMKTTILNQPQVQDYTRRHFRPIRIDTKGDQPIIDFRGREWLEKDFAFKVFRVRATPVFLFLGLDGTLRYRHTGIVRDTREFLWLIDYVAQGHYRSKKFPVYKRERRAGGRSPG